MLSKLSREGGNRTDNMNENNIETETLTTTTKYATNIILEHECSQPARPSACQQSDQTRPYSQPSAVLLMTMMTVIAVAVMNKTKPTKKKLLPCYVSCSILNNIMLRISKCHVLFCRFTAVDVDANQSASQPAGCFGSVLSRNPFNPTAAAAETASTSTSAAVALLLGCLLQLLLLLHGDYYKPCSPTCGLLLLRLLLPQWLLVFFCCCSCCHYYGGIFRPCR